MSDVDRLFDTRDEIDRAAQVFGAASRSAATGYDGKDEFGTATVRLTPEGHLQDVRISMDWRTRVGADGLAAAVQAAITTAGVRRLEEWGHGMDVSMSGPPPSLSPAPALYETMAGRLEDRVRSAKTPREVAAVEQALVEVMDELIRDVDELTEQVDTALTSSVRGESSHEKHAVAEMSLTGEVVALEYDERWLARAHPANIGRETLAAVDAARRALAGRSITDVIAQSRLQQLQVLLNDPDAVAQRLGL